MKEGRKEGMTEGRVERERERERRRGKDKKVAKLENKINLTSFCAAFRTRKGKKVQL